MLAQEFLPPPPHAIPEVAAAGLSQLALSMSIGSGKLSMLLNIEEVWRAVGSCVNCHTHNYPYQPLMLSLLACYATLPHCYTCSSKDPCLPGLQVVHTVG